MKLKKHEMYLIAFYYLLNNKSFEKNENIKKNNIWSKNPLIKDFSYILQNCKSRKHIKKTWRIEKENLYSLSYEWDLRVKELFLFFNEEKKEEILKEFNL